MQCGREGHALLLRSYYNTEILNAAKDATEFIERRIEIQVPIFWKLEISPLET
jgi:hypothetical protein